MKKTKIESKQKLITIDVGDKFEYNGHQYTALLDRDAKKGTISCLTSFLSIVKFNEDTMVTVVTSSPTFK
jgi:hypothetical protein